MNMSPKNKAHFLAEKEAIHLILTGIRDEIYSTVDACQTAQEMWEAIERLQQGESFNIQDIKINLFWEFDKFTSHDGETMESYYTRFYKLMNEMIQNNLTVTTMQVNVQFLQQLQPEWLSNPEQAQRDKDMQKNLALIAKYFKKIYKPTNNNLRTSSNSRINNVDTTPRYKNDDHSGQFGNQRMVNVAGAREKVGSSAEQYDWLADTDEEVNEQELEAHYSYMAKIQEVPTADLGTDFEPLEQVQNDAGYNVFANDLQHYEQSESISNTCLVETDYSNVIPDSPDMCEDDIQNEQNDVERDDERVVLANLKLDTKQTEFEKYKAFNDRTVDYDKLEHKLNEVLGQIAHKDTVIREDLFRAPTALDMEILIQTCLMPLAIKTQGDSLKFVRKLKQEIHIDLKYVESLEKVIDELESEKAEFSDMYDVILYDFVSKDVMCSYLQSLSDLDALAELQ
nr:hypothetical protein [Tanacetum cinerariifolium]